ncbi:uncharacterized protein VTP21DRAFT_11096 [Calcarisporiella thermophila]|uniref:uncharacterized protein n=1 Tax=Calcarisporiella thermophila TaxID=911321 RepID=UPI003742A36F
MAALNPPAAEDQVKLLEDALSVVRVQAFQMKKCLENNRLMDGLKHCSTMLAELRTSSLNPKSYYELYMAIFDALRHLASYLHDAHTSGRHHLADLYELVQYAGNIVPRLYLMITVGCVYLEMDGAPKKEILRDMLEMCRGVMHPTRGLFLRHYLSGLTKDHLPTENNEGPQGNLNDSIEFILTNFTEMNKLWVRLQHQGPSREREKREMERRDLRILVGTNLVRLSQLEGVDLKIYKEKILPSILEQIVICKDALAQEYLLEAIIQVFHDDLHLRTLAPLLSAVAQLHPKVNIRQIITALIDRLAAYATREADSEQTEEPKILNQDPNVPADKNGGNEQGNGEILHQDCQQVAQGSNPNSEPSETASNDDNEANSKKESEKIRGIPEGVNLFGVFWEQIVALTKARPDLTLEDIIALLVSLTNLSINCYPKEVAYVDQVFGFALEKFNDFTESPEINAPQSTKNLQNLLLSPIQRYPSVLTLRSITNYAPLLARQSFLTRRTVSHAVVTSILKNSTIIEDPEDATVIFELCGVLLRDQKDAPKSGDGSEFMHGEYDLEDSAEEQGWLARMIHLLKSDDVDQQFKLLSIARNQFSEGGERIRYTYPALTVAGMKLARRYKPIDQGDEANERKCTTLFRFLHQIISTLYTKVDTPDISLRLFLLAAQSADEKGFEEIAYEFFVQAFTIYEESISESHAQFQAITMIIGSLQTTRCFGSENYDTLATKAALYGNRLLKKPDQCRAVYLCSHLSWATEHSMQEEGKVDEPLLRDDKRVLESLQKALKIADACLDSATSTELFVEILNRYIYYFQRGNEVITVKYLNGLIDLINTNLTNLGSDQTNSLPTPSSSSLIEVGNISEFVIKHFKNTLAHLKRRKEHALSALATGDNHGANYQDVDITFALDA